jgi:crossover junction endodeoxyribonuclease RuvC
MNTAILGIDPGLDGALALYDVDGSLEVVDMPTLQLKKRVIDEYALARIIDAWSPRIREVWLEQVGTRPGEGAVGAFSFGRGYGLLRGICAASFLTIIDVTPATWKAGMKVRGDKDASRAKASALFPRHASLWPLKKHDGRAEAALIARFGMLQSAPPPAAPSINLREAA